MNVICWGTRGSTPTPLSPAQVAAKIQRAIQTLAIARDRSSASSDQGRSTWSTYGGDTACVEVGLTEDVRLVFDMGTGLRAMSDRLLEQGDRAYHLVVFMSHLHMDHLTGLPMARVAYLPQTRIEIHGDHRQEPLQKLISGFERPPYWPITIDQMGARFQFQEFRAGGQPIWESGPGQPRATVRGWPVNHPGGCVSFRLDVEGAALVYATDRDAADRDPGFAAFARGARYLIHDCQFTPEEYDGRIGPSRQTWGHSTYVTAVETALEAGVGELILFHHDPAHDDEAIDQMADLAVEQMARRSAQTGRPAIPVSAGFDGQLIEL